MASSRVPKNQYSDLVNAIIAGEHDADLDMIQQAAKYRLKNLWRPRMRVVVHGTKNPSLDGKEAVIIKVNQKSISIGVGAATTDQWGTEYEGGQWNVSPALLSKVEA